MKKLITILMFVLSPVSQACMCVAKMVDINDSYNSASAIYWAAISKVETENVANGRADLSINLKVLSTYKGEAQNHIQAQSSHSFPTNNKDGGFESKFTSCDSRYQIGQDYLIAVFDNEAVQLRQCSSNLLQLSEINMKKLAELSASNKAINCRKSSALFCVSLRDFTQKTTPL